MRTTTNRTPIESTSFVNKDGIIVRDIMTSIDTKITYKFIVDNNETVIEIDPQALQFIIH